MTRLLTYTPVTSPYPNRLELMNEPKQDKSLCNFQKGTLAKLRRICGPDFPLCVGCLRICRLCLATDAHVLL